MTGCFDVYAASSPNEGQHDCICNLRMSLPDHWERVGPTGPISCLGSSNRAAESESSVPAGETGKIQCLMPASNVGQLQKHLPNGRVMLPREFLQRPRVNHPEEIVCPGNCAEHKYQPRALKVWHGFCVLGACIATGLSRSPHVPRGSPTRQSLDGDLGACGRHATITGGVISLPAWRMCWQPSGKKPPLLNNCVLPKLMRMPA